jgi:hypothetical protein
MDIAIFGVFGLLLIPLAGILAAIYLLSRRGRG